MKKIFIISLVTLLLGGYALASEYTKFSRKFIRHIKDCDAYEETIASEYEDSSFKTTRKIHGWKNGYCRYTETITAPQGAYKLDCGFTEVQLDDLYEAMKDRSKKADKYTLDLYSERKNPKTGDTEYMDNLHKLFQAFPATEHTLSGQNTKTILLYADLPKLLSKQVKSASNHKYF